LPAVAKSAIGTVIVKEVPAAFAVPPVSTALPKLTCVELLKPVPVNVSCWGEVAPAITPRAGVNDDKVGVALSMLVGSVADLSVVLLSFGSDTVTELVTAKVVGDEIAFGPIDTVIVNVLLPPPAASAGPEYVHVTTCAFCAPAEQAQLAPALETKIRPVGKVSVTVIAPVVGAVPLFVSVIV